MAREVPPQALSIRHTLAELTAQLPELLRRELSRLVTAAARLGSWPNRARPGVPLTSLTLLTLSTLLALLALALTLLTFALLLTLLALALLALALLALLTFASLLPL